MDIMIVICGYSENFSVYGYYHENNATVEIWVMNEYTLQSSWISSVSISLFMSLCKQCGCEI
jgi:hypothetical protein